MSPKSEQQFKREIKGYISPKNSDDEERRQYEEKIKSLAMRCAEGFGSSDGERVHPHLFCIYGVDNHTLDIAEVVVRKYLDSHKMEDVKIERSNREGGYRVDLGALLNNFNNGS